MLRKGRTAMSELDKIRENINSIDEQMAQLFEKRMEMSEQVVAFKKARGLSIRDAERERELIDRNRRHITDPAVASYYVQFLQGVLDLSCAYQSRLLSGMKVAYSGLSPIPILPPPTELWRWERRTAWCCRWRTATPARWVR